MDVAGQGLGGPVDVAGAVVDVEGEAEPAGAHGGDDAGPLQPETDVRCGGEAGELLSPRPPFHAVRRRCHDSHLPPRPGEHRLKIASSAVSLNVDDVAASSAFLTTHFGFHEEMAADGFASLARDDAGMNVVFLRRGLDSLPADQRDDHASGVILAFVVEDLEQELARLQDEGVTITMPLTAEEWGERAFQVRDPNGVIVQLVDWNAPTNH